MRAGGAAASPRRPATRVEALIARFARGREVSGATTLEELGLSSLERVELMVALEDRFQTRIDEARFAEAASVARSQAARRARPPPPSGVDEPVDFPTWNRTWPVRLVRRLSLATWILPLARVFAHARVEGLRAPARPRRPGGVRVEPPEPHGRAGDPGGAAGPLARARGAGDAKEFFKAHFFPAEHTLAAVVHQLAATTTWRAFYFNAFPLPQREAGARQTLQYIGELTGDGLVDPDLSRRACGRRPATSSRSAAASA